MRSELSSDTYPASPISEYNPPKQYWQARPIILYEWCYLWNRGIIPPSFSRTSVGATPPLDDVILALSIWVFGCNTQRDTRLLKACTISCVWVPYLLLLRPLPVIGQLELSEPAQPITGSGRSKSRYQTQTQNILGSIQQNCSIWSCYAIAVTLGPGCPCAARWRRSSNISWSRTSSGGATSTMTTSWTWCLWPSCCRGTVTARCDSGPIMLSPGTTPASPGTWARPPRPRRCGWCPPRAQTPRSGSRRAGRASACPAPWPWGWLPSPCE